MTMPTETVQDGPSYQADATWWLPLPLRRALLLTPPFVAIAGAVALRTAGADRLTVALMAVSLVFANHPPPSGTIGLLALCAAAYRWDRRRQPSRTSTPPPVPDSKPEGLGSQPSRPFA
jgi:hypothetical protein